MVGSGNKSTFISPGIHLLITSLFFVSLLVTSFFCVLFDNKSFLFTTFHVVMHRCVSLCSYLCSYY